MLFTHVQSISYIKYIVYTVNIVIIFENVYIIIEGSNWLYLAYIYGWNQILVAGESMADKQ